MHLALSPHHGPGAYRLRGARIGEGNLAEEEKSYEMNFSTLIFLRKVFFYFLVTQFQILTLLHLKLVDQSYTSKESR